MITARTRQQTFSAPVGFLDSNNKTLTVPSADFLPWRSKEEDKNVHASYETFLKEQTI